jgi:hypothetical protein
VTGPLVRIELGVVRVSATDNQKTEVQPAETLVMPLDGFLQSFGLMDAVVKKLVADGLIRPQPAPGTAAPAGG